MTEHENNTTITAHITLPLEAAVRVEDHTGTRVDQESLLDALAMIRQRARTRSALVKLHRDHQRDARFHTGTWKLTAEDVEPIESVTTADYTLYYTAYLMTDTTGVTRQVQLAQIDGIAQRLANETGQPVFIDSALIGLDPWTVEPAPTPAPVEAEVSDEHQEAKDDSVPHPELITSTETAEEVAAPVESRQTSFAETFASQRTTRRDMMAPATEGWRGSTNRVLRTKLRPGSHEREMREVRSRIQQGLDGSKTVMIANIKGGGTKTTNTFMAGAAIGRVRGGNVLSWDNNENAGNLVTRGQRAPHGRTAIELYDQLAQLTTLENVDKLTHYMHPQGDNRFDVLASQDVAGTKQVIDADAFRSMHSILRTFYSMVLVDTGNATNATTWQATAEAADVIVLTMQNTEDSANGAAQTLDAIRKHVGDEKVSNAVAVITQTAHPSKERAERIHETIGSKIRAVLEVPFDQALKEGEGIVWESLTPATREAYMHVAASIVDGLSH